MSKRYRYVDPSIMKVAVCQSYVYQCGCRLKVSFNHISDHATFCASGIKRSNALSQSNRPYNWTRSAVHLATRVANLFPNHVAAAFPVR